MVAEAREHVEPQPRGRDDSESPGHVCEATGEVVPGWVSSLPQGLQSALQQGYRLYGSSVFPTVDWLGIYSYK